LDPLAGSEVLEVFFASASAKSSQDVTKPKSKTSSHLLHLDPEQVEMDKFFASLFGLVMNWAHGRFKLVMCTLCKADFTGLVTF
jgi:hypothetical protein